MEDNSQDLRARHITQVVQVVNDILQAQKAILERIEVGYREQLEVYNELKSRIDLLDKKIEGGFTVLETTRIDSLDKTVSAKLKNIQYSYIRELKQKIDAINIKLQQQVQAKMLQLMIKGSMKPIQKSSERGLVAERPVRRVPSYRPTPLGVPAPAAPASLSAQEIELPESEDGDWMESEIEGAQIYDTIITGWKRRDWEGIEGDKETFMRGWRKLSNSDRQKIKNGAWSKPIMNKIKLLGRSS